MAKEKKIQDYDWCYNALRYYVDFVLKLSYRNVRYVGTENIPQNGAVIYAPNHTNALMDALVILAMDRKPKGGSKPWNRPHRREPPSIDTCRQPGFQP